MSSSLGGQLWGKIPPLVDTESGIAAIERELITKPRALNSAIGAKFGRAQLVPDPLPEKSVPVGNSIIIETIQLAQSLRKLKSNAGNPGPINPGQDPYPGLSVKTERVSPMSFSKKSVNEYLRKVVILLCTHSGYELASESIIDLLVDVCDDYLRHICLLLRDAVDHKNLTDSGDFIDVIDRVFHSLGFSFSSLQNYETSLKSYKSNIAKELSRRSASLMNETKNIPSNVFPMDISAMHMNGSGSQLDESDSLMITELMRDSFSFDML